MRRPAETCPVQRAPGQRSRVAARIIAVAGGKGGVGKSVLSANLAVAMAASGRRVALVDADIGMGNQHTLLGIARPGPGLVGFLRDESLDLDRVGVETGHRNLTLYPSDGALGVPQVSQSRKDRLVEHVSRLDADVVLLDIGAGAALTALDLFALADLHVLVLTGQVTSIQNAYGFLKAAVQRLVVRSADTPARRELIEQGWREARPPAAVTLVDWLRQRDAALADNVQRLASRVSVRLVGNLLFDDNDHRVPPSIGRMIRDYLGLDAAVAGLVPSSRRIHESITQRRPVILIDPNCAASAELRRVAGRLLDQPLPDRRLVSERLAPGAAGAREAAV